MSREEVLVLDPEEQVYDEGCLRGGWKKVFFASVYL
jgi:hypothetical protein